MIISERILRAKKDLALFCKKLSKWQLSDIPHGKFHSYNFQYMAKKKVTTIKEHPREVPVSKKNPTGITIVDKHPRRLKGTYLNAKEINETFKSYDKKKIVYPTSKKLPKYFDI